MLTPLGNTREFAMKVHYLEIVTSDVDGVCAGYEAALGVRFGSADPLLGGARTAPLADGGSVGVRGPLRDTEMPVVRPYWLVDNLEAALDAASKQGAMVALPAMEIPGKGRIAIYIQGGVDHGLWQV
jgi:predicted enzyme related to lactoylglutathione lyase